VSTSIFRTVWLLLSVIFFQQLAAAQQPVAQQFAAADWFSRPLGAGVVWKFYHFDNLFGAPQTISYVEADMNTPGVRLELPYRDNGRAKTTQLVAGDFPGSAAGINGTFFGYNDAGRLGHTTYLRVNGREVPPSFNWSNYGYQAGLVFNRSTNVSRVIGRPRDTGGSAAGPADWRTNAGSYTDAIVAGPILMRNGAVTRSNYSNLGSHCDARHPRTMVGMKTGNKLIFVVADGRFPGLAAGLTCEEMAQVMQALGCADAFSLDGGGSSLLYGRGEPFSGILNYPSDNGGWDHDPADERSVVNAVAVIAGAASPLPFDARVQVVSAPTTLLQGQTKAATVRLTNIGSETWRNGRVSITTARPAKHASPFYASSTWTDSATAWTLPSGTEVRPGQILQVSFQVKGPAVAGMASIKEYFQLTLDNAARFGPPDDEIEFNVTVSPGANNLIVESRVGGANYAWYSDSDMADTATGCTAPGATAAIGMRYGSTYRSVAGAKSAQWQPSLPQRGFYRVYVSWGAATLRRSPVTYHVNHRGGRETFQIDQAATANTWVPLGDRTYEFEAGPGTGHGVQMTNENIDVSGNMYAGPVWFEFVGTSDVAGWELY
jgi:hypothetical protein